MAVFLVSSPPAAQQSFDDLNWLADRWLGATGKTTFREHCTRVEGGIMWGMAYTLIDAKLTSFEAMRIELDSNNMLVFVPKPFGKSRDAFRYLKNIEADLFLKICNTTFLSALFIKRKRMGGYVHTVNNDPTSSAPHPLPILRYPVATFPDRPQSVKNQHSLRPGRHFCL